MRLIRIITLFFCLSICIISCRELYEPELLEFDFEFLVAEGYVEVGGGTSQLRLGKTTTIYAEESIRPISRAVVYLNGSNEGRWQFGHLREGEFELQADLPVNQNYKLEIQVEEVEHYESEWMQTRISPEIEKVYFIKAEGGDVFVYLDSRGSGEENFYRWTSEETWEFKTPYMGFFRYDHELDDVVYRDDNINLCYRSEISDRIVMGTSSRTVDGSVKGVEIQKIPPRSEKLGIRYSIEVTQSPIGQKAFEFWEAIRKNTEDIGDIFSPMPSVFESNLRKIGEDTPVIGFISAGRSSKKRLFIEFTEIRPWAPRIPEYIDCAKIDTVPDYLYASYFNSGQLIPLEEIEIEWPPDSFIFIPAYISAEKKCVDCRLRGTTEKPEFWD